MVIFQSGHQGIDHALNATRAAFAVHQWTAALNEEYGGVFPSIQLHMGINSGEALVGATKLSGAVAERWTFTATGPTANIAARLAGFATAGQIIVGPLTAKRVRQQFVLEVARRADVQECVRTGDGLSCDSAWRLREDPLSKGFSGIAPAPRTR